MRVALVILLVHGLVPALGEVTEAAVHYAIEGHLAHTGADLGDLGDQGDEHGCGTTQHQCGCCASQFVASAPKVEVSETRVLAPGHSPSPGTLSSLHEPAPPYRPPIAS